MARGFRTKIRVKFRHVNGALGKRYRIFGMDHQLCFSSAHVYKSNTFLFTVDFLHTAPLTLTTLFTIQLGFTKVINICSTLSRFIALYLFNWHQGIIVKQLPETDFEREL